MNISNYITTVLRDHERKHIFKIFKEALHCAILEKEIPIYYFTSLLHKKDNADNYLNYIGHRRINKIINNDFYGGTNSRNHNLKNKLLFDKQLVENNIRTIKLLAYSNKYMLHLKEGDIINVVDVGTLESYLTELIEHSLHESVFIKPIDGAGGKDTFKIDKNDLVTKDKIVKLYELMNVQNYIIQETIKQHEDISLIYPHSLNTLRVHSYYDKSTSKTLIVSALMRFGRGGNVVDNISSGGLFVSVDTDKWLLTGKGRSFLKYGGETYDFHPDTNYRFHGFKIPYSDEIENLISQVAKLFSNNFIGWDISITNEGPIIIEGNDCPHLIMAQMACGGFKSHPIYKEIFKEYID